VLIGHYRMHQAAIERKLRRAKQVPMAGDLHGDWDFRIQGDGP
jgi:hypothetical protein